MSRWQVAGLFGAVVGVGRAVMSLGLGSWLRKCSETVFGVFKEQCTAVYACYSASPQQSG